MKVVSVHECKSYLSAYLDQCQFQKVLVTKHGKPVCVMIGVQGTELEEMLLANDDTFWAMLQQRRAHSKPLSLQEIKRRFAKSDSPNNS